MFMLINIFLLMGFNGVVISCFVLNFIIDNMWCLFFYRLKGDEYRDSFYGILWKLIIILLIN